MLSLVKSLTTKGLFFKVPKNMSLRFSIFVSIYKTLLIKTQELKKVVGI